MAITGSDTYVTTGSKKIPIDGLSYINSVVTPIFDMAKKGKPSVDINDYWNYVTYAVPTDSDARAEGATLTDDTEPTEAQFVNYTEVNSETYRVTSSLQARAKNGGQVGTADYIARRKREAAEKLKMKNEWAFLNNTGVAGDATPTARKQKGLITIAASGVTANIASATFGGAVGELAYKTHVDAIRAAGGVMAPKKAIMVSWANKTKMAAWVGRATQVQDVAGSGIINSDIDVYKCQYGSFAVMGHDLMPADKVLTFNPAEIEINPFDPTSTEENAVGKLFKEYAMSNELNIRYRPVSTLGLATLT